MANAKDFYFYVLHCADDTLYGGYTTDIMRREQEHNAGTGAKYTRARLPVKLIYSERFDTRSEATKREWWFKHKLTRKQKFSFLAEHGVDL
jgi:putative endonuclease